MHSRHRLAECLNVVWKHAKLLADLESDLVESTVEDLKRVYEGLNVYSTKELSETAIAIALNHNMPVYDALYIAASQKTNATLFTADQKLNQTANTLANSKLLKLRTEQ